MKWATDIKTGENNRQMFLLFIGNKQTHWDIQAQQQDKEIIVLINESK